jgi:hypothetical protein
MHPPPHPEADCQALCEVEGDGVQGDVQVVVDDVGLHEERKKEGYRWTEGGKKAERWR